MSFSPLAPRDGPSVLRPHVRPGRSRDLWDCRAIASTVGWIYWGSHWRQHWTQSSVATAVSVCMSTRRVLAQIKPLTALPNQFGSIQIPRPIFMKFSDGIMIAECRARYAGQSDGGPGGCRAIRSNSVICQSSG